MTARLLVAAAAAAAAVAIGLALFHETGVAGGSRPNVVVVMTDDQDPASVGVMKAVEHELAARGVTFANNYATTPDCCPSRASFETGQYAHNHGVLTRHPPRGGYQGFAAQPALIKNALPVALQDAGYRTGYIGKYLNGYGIPDYGGLRSPGIRRYIPPGWDRWYVPVDHTEYDMYGYRLNENGRLRTYGTAPRDYQTDVYARKAQAFVRASASQPQPFFLTVAPLAPHLENPIAPGPRERGRNPRPALRDLGRFARRPLPRPPSFNERKISDKPSFVRNTPRLSNSEIRQLRLEYHSRLESLLAVDDLVRGLVHQLRATGELDNTYIVFTSDNGFMLGQHRRHGKLSVYEESVRVPLIIRGPGLPARQVRSQLTANIDLAPTILDAASTPPRLEMDGISLLPGARDPAADANRSLVLEYLAGHRAYSAVRTADGFAYVEYRDGERELYDLNTDPYELHNLAGKPADAALELDLARHLAALRNCAGKSCDSPG
ncbi:MAG TPA: sulfatase [Solirubrobacterales bacterium]|nr:sulfatase [Solirubrobacterales bacterium]